MDLRRKIALWLCPDLTTLPYSIKDRHQKLRMPSRKSIECAEHIARLDRLYAAYTGALLNHNNAPNYDGHMYSWPSSRAEIKYDAVRHIISLRYGRQIGVHTTKAFVTLNYLGSIWPDAELDWPVDIPRPPKNRKEAA